MPEAVDQKLLARSGITVMLLLEKSVDNKNKQNDYFARIEYNLITIM
jgi:hypothetical protein